MTKHNKLSLFPVYDEKKGIFLGYAVKKDNHFLKDKTGNKIILSVQTTVDNGYFVTYQNTKWTLNISEHEQYKEPQLKFTPKAQNGSFKGYTITQYDEKENTLMPRGTVAPSDIKYKQNPNGFIDCFYEDKQTDGSCKTYFIQQISLDEYEQRKV